MSKVEIYNVTGNLVKSFDYTITVDQTQINLSELNSGMFFITIYNGSSSGSAKILKF